MDITNIVTALGAATITGLVAIFSSFLASSNSIKVQNLQREHDSETKKKSFMLERGEELFVSINKFATQTAVVHLPLYAVMKGELTYNHYLDHLISRTKKIDYDPTRIELLIQVYFPELSREYDIIRGKIDELNDVIERHKCTYKDSGGEEAPQFILPLQESQLTLENEFENLKSKIASETRKFAA